MTEPDDEIADGGDEARETGESVSASVDDTDGAEVVLADGGIRVDAERRADVAEHSLAGGVRRLCVASQGVSCEGVDELTNCLLYTRVTADREAE